MATIDDVIITVDTGVRGRPGIVWRGDWSSSNTYYAGDAVSSGGHAFVADRFIPAGGTQPAVDSSGASTVTGWDVLALRGEAGRPTDEQVDEAVTEYFDNNPAVVRIPVYSSTAQYNFGDRVLFNSGTASTPDWEFFIWTGGADVAGVPVTNSRWLNFEASIQADWNQTDTSALDYIENKPFDSVDTSGALSIDSGVLSSTGEENVQSDWNQTDATADNYIENKPTFSDTANDGDTLGVNFEMDSNNVITATVDASSISTGGDAGFQVAASASPAIIDLFSSITESVITITATEGDLTGATYSNIMITGGPTAARIGSTDTFRVSGIRTSTTNTFNFAVDVTNMVGGRPVVHTARATIRVEDRRVPPSLSGSARHERLSGNYQLTVNVGGHPLTSGQSFTLSGAGADIEQSSNVFSIPVDRFTTDGSHTLTVSYLDSFGTNHVLMHSVEIFSPIRSGVSATQPTAIGDLTNVALDQEVIYRGAGGLYFAVPDTITPVFRSGFLFLSNTALGDLDAFWTLYRVDDYTGTSTLGVLVEEA